MKVKFVIARAQTRTAKLARPWSRTTIAASIFAFASMFLIVDFPAWILARGNYQDSSPPLKAENDWGQTVRDVINHEIKAQARDTSLWCYQKLMQKNGREKVLEACQTRGGEIDRLEAMNGRPLDEQQKRAEDKRIENLLGSPRELIKKEREQRKDAKQATELLRLIPDAFLFQKEAMDGDQITLKFTPNPRFHPSGHEASVFHHMEGTLILDLKQKRLAEINGHLTSEVKFGGGILGHLDKGGTFLVKQQEVAAGCWEVAMLNVNMNGKALFFKTIGVRQKEIDSGFQAVPQSETIQQAAVMTKARNMKLAGRK